MRIGLISDTHNDLGAIRRALAQLRLDGIATVLHAGDLTGPPALRLLEGFDAWIARGNMDHHTSLDHIAQELFGPGHFRSVHRLSLGGVAIALIHDSDSAVGRQLAMSREYDYVVSGHSHRKHDERLGPTRLLNPGALGNARWHRASFAVLDLATGDVSWIDV